MRWLGFSSQAPGGITFLYPLELTGFDSRNVSRRGMSDPGQEAFDIST